MRVRLRSAIGSFEYLDGASPALDASVTRAIYEVSSVYAKALIAAGVRSFSAPLQSLDWAMGTDTVRDAIGANLKTLGKRIYDWSTRMRSNAANNAPPYPGDPPFTWAKWAELGKVFADEAAYSVQMTWDSSPLMTILDTLKATARQLNPAEPMAWPTWLKVAVGLGGVVAAAYVVNTIIRAKREISAGYGEEYGDVDDEFTFDYDMEGWRR